MNSRNVIDKQINELKKLRDRVLSLNLRGFVWIENLVEGSPCQEQDYENIKYSSNWVSENKICIRCLDTETNNSLYLTQHDDDFLDETRYTFQWAPGEENHVELSMSDVLQYNSVMEMVYELYKKYKPAEQYVVNFILIY